MRRTSILCASALTAATAFIAGCGPSSGPSFQVGDCINWSINSNGAQVPLKVNCSHPPDPAIDVVKAIAPSGQSCTVGDRFYMRDDGSTLCLEGEYVMSTGG
jgi:hypothetical protein